MCQTGGSGAARHRARNGRLCRPGLVRGKWLWIAYALRLALVERTFPTHLRFQGREPPRLDEGDALGGLRIEYSFPDWVPVSEQVPASRIKTSALDLTPSLTLEPTTQTDSVVLETVTNNVVSTFELFLLVTKAKKLESP